MTLQPDRTFDRFTPTRGSRLALELGLAVARDTPDAPGFLLAHGPPGVGKTHLLHAIVNLWAARQPNRLAICVGAGELAEQWVAALKGNSKADLPRHLEGSHLVAIDDLHVLAGKPATQGEVARAFGATIRRGEGDGPASLGAGLSARSGPAARGEAVARAAGRYEAGRSARPPDVALRGCLGGATP